MQNKFTPDSFREAILGRVSIVRLFDSRSVPRGPYESHSELSVQATWNFHFSTKNFLKICYKVMYRHLNNTA